MIRSWRDRRRSTIASFVLVTTLGALWASVAWILSVSVNDVQRDAVISFQDRAGAMTGGAAASPRWCFHSIDPRLESVCPTALRPVPGLPAYCPDESMGLRTPPARPIAERR